MTPFEKLDMLSNNLHEDMHQIRRFSSDDYPKHLLLDILDWYKEELERILQEFKDVS